LPWQQPLDTWSQLCLHRIAWPRKPTPRIKQRVTTYHNNQNYSQSKAKNWLPWQRPSAHVDPIWHMIPTACPSPNGIWIGSAVFAQMTIIECPYALQWDAPFPSKIAPSHGGSGPHLIHGSLGPTESSMQTASRSVQPFLQGSLVWQTDQQTDHATRSITIGHIYVRSTAMWLNSSKWSK